VIRRDGAVYLTQRGYVAAEDLRPEEAADLAPVFQLRDARLLDPDCFRALAARLGLDVVTTVRGLVARFRG
jgi:hypothetical protein